MALTATFFDAFFEDVAEGVHNLGSDTLKLALSNTAPTASTDGQLSDITQIANGNGYTTGGETTTLVSSSQTSGTYKLVTASVTWTCATSNMGTFQYVILYNDTATNDELICFWTLSSAVTLTPGDKYQATVNATNGILTLTSA